jgi:hypothetical protein
MDFESLLEALLYVKSTITMPVSQFFIYIFLFLEVGNGNAVFKKRAMRLLFSKQNIIYFIKKSTFTLLI